MKCQECGKENPDYTNFCQECGEKMQNAKDVEKLVEALLGEDYSLKKEAVDNLIKIGKPSVEPLIDAIVKADKEDYSWYSLKDNAAIILVKIGESSVDPLITILKDGEIVVRNYAADVLGKIGDTRAVESLMDASQDVNDEMRAYAIRALDKIDNSTSKNVLKSYEEKSGSGVVRLTEYRYQSQINTLLGLGLVDSSFDRVFELTEDGILYIDGMFCASRDCSLHSSSMDDLKAVSRGRFISLNQEELTLLASIYLGKSFTSDVYNYAHKMGFENYINGALMEIAGTLAHGVRHNNDNEGSSNPWGIVLSPSKGVKHNNDTEGKMITDNIRLTKAGKAVFKKHLELNLNGSHPGIELLVKNVINNHEDLDIKL